MNGRSVIFKLKSGLQHPVLLTAGANTLSNATRLGVSLVSIPFLLSQYGQEALGIWFFATSIIMLTGFAQSGLAGAMTTAMGRSQGNTSQDEGRSIVQGTISLAIRYSTLFFVLLVTVIYLIDWSMLLNAEDISNLALKQLLWATTISIACGFYFATAKAILVGTMRGYFFYSIEALSRIAGLIFFLMAAWKGLPIHVLFLCLFLLPDLVTTLIVFSYLWRKGQLAPPSDKALIAKNRSELHKHGVRLAMNGAAGSFANSSDLIIISVALGPQAASSFGIAQRLYAVLMMLVPTINDALWPLYSKHLGQGRTKDVARNFKVSSLTLIGVALVFSIFLSLNMELITKFWLGKAYTYNPIFVCIFSLNALLNIYLHSLTTVLKASNKTRILLKTNVVFAGINIILSVLMCYLLGYVGVILATVLSQIFIQLMPFRNAVRSAIYQDTTT